MMAIVFAMTNWRVASADRKPQKPSESQITEAARSFYKRVPKARESPEAIRKPL